MMADTSEWELSKENVQPLRQGRKVASLTSALQHTPADLQQIKSQKDVFERQLRIYDGDDPLEIWDCYIKWTEQNFPSGGKEGNLNELLQRCLTHFKDHEKYKDDQRFVHIWIKFANFISDPIEIFIYMFEQSIGCGVALLYEEWANLLERLGNTKKADAIYLEGISRRAQPLDELKKKHSEFQMRVARGLTLQQREEEEERQVGEEQRTVLGGLKADKKNRVGTTRTGSAKLGRSQGLGHSHVAPQIQQQNKAGIQIFQDENAPVFSAPQQTGQSRSIPKREQLNRENEQAPSMWTKARAPQRRGVAAAASVPVQPTFHIHEDENAVQQQHTNAVVVDSHVLSARKAEKPGHMLDPIRNQVSRDERPMYCKEKIYCGTQEFSFEELRALRYTERKRIQQQEEEQRKVAQQLSEMRMMQEQVQKDLEMMRAERRQFLAMQRQAQMNISSQDSSDVQPSTMPFGGSTQAAQSASSSDGALASAPSSASFSGSFPMVQPSGSMSGPMSRSSASTGNLHSSAPSSADSSICRVGAGAVQNSSLNSSQRTPVMNSAGPGAGSSSGGQLQLQQSRSGGPTPDSNTSRQSLTSASPSIFTKEAFQMVQGMYNATLDCDKLWPQEDTEMTEAVAAPAASNPIVVFEEPAQPLAQPAAVPVFCDENAGKENRLTSGDSQASKGLKGLAKPGGRLALQEKHVPVASAAPTEATADVDSLGEGTEFFPLHDRTLAAVGSQDSFAAAARAASTPFGFSTRDGRRLPSLPLSCVKPPVVSRKNSDEEMTDAACVQNSQCDVQESQHTQFRTFNTTRVSPGKNDLSPIVEGSNEGSSDESKSQAASTLGVSSMSALKMSSASSSQRHPELVSLDGEMAPASDDQDEPMDQHVIDTSHYIPAEMDEKTEAVLSMSVCIDPHNPFDETTIKNFLKKIRSPLNQRKGYVACNQHVPGFTGCHFINLGTDTYQLKGLIGEGGYAKVYQATTFNMDLDDSMNTMDFDPTGTVDYVIKVQKPVAEWEFYICSEVHQRLMKLGLSSMRQCMMEISQGYFYQDGSCLLSEFCPMGSLLTRVNQIKHERQLMANLEPLAAYITVQLLHIVESLHRCHIIHGDIKPDNILLTGFPKQVNCSSKDVVFGLDSQCMRLVDFGQAIDMSLYPPGTTFMAKVGTSGFQCIEMMTDQPWTYQTDMFGLAGSLHVLIFGQYMKVYCSQGQWHMTSSFQRKWKVDLWKKLFHQLLNIEDCDHQPDLSALRREFEDHFMSNLAPNFNYVLAMMRAKVSNV